MTPERRSLAARRAPRALPRRAPRSRVRGRRPPRRPASTFHSSHQRATPRAYHLRKAGGGRRPYSRPSEGSWCAAVAAARGALVPGGEARTTASDREARREARGGQSRPQTTVCRCGAPFDRAGGAPRTGRCEERGLREDAEPTSLRHGKRSVAEACASKEPRPQALWSLGAVRGGARPREHTQAVVSRRRSPLRSAAESTGRETTSSRPTAWCRAALEPRRSARTPRGRRPSQPPACRLYRTGSGPLARLRTATAAGSGGGHSAGLGSQGAVRNAAGCRRVAALQARSLFILKRDFLNV